jgi:hypothetical protein
MVFTKKATKAPAVMVETKKLSAKDNCGMGMGFCGKMSHLLVPVLLLINLLLIVWVLSNQMNLESARVGGRDNYKMVQQIYKSDAFKAQQKQQIEQALQMYNQGATTTVSPVTTTTAPTPTPVVTE